MTGGTGGGDGDRLGVADEFDIVVVAFVFGIVPEVEAVGDDGAVLGLDELAEDVDDKGRVALLAFGALIVREGIGGRAGGAVGGLAEGALALTGSAWSETNPSAVVIVYQLNLKSGTVSGSPFRSQ